MSRARIIVNRRARRLADDGRLLHELSRTRGDTEIFETSSLDELDAVARTLLSRARDGDVVVLAGGDGSYMAGVTALTRNNVQNTRLRIALAPGGTVGTVARNWGMRGDPVRYARDLLDAIATGSFRTTTRPSLRVRGPEERIGFIFGAGLVARFFEVYESRGAKGNLGAARIVARVFAGSFVGSPFARSILEPSPGTLDVDGERAPFDRISLVCASVVGDLGLGMRLLYRAGEAHDRFHVVATPLGPRALGPQMPLVLAGRPLRGPRVDTLARKLRLSLTRGAYVLDGDLFRADMIEVEPGPLLDVVTAR